jgi:hypothetical protein
MRNIVILGCALLLAIGLSFSSFAGSVVDADSDGIPDIYDNCLGTPNGPLLGTNDCDSQLDADQDGYGNACDLDLNNDGYTFGDDVGLLLAADGDVVACPECDFNCDGFVLGDDVGLMLVGFGNLPGPSGLACAAAGPAPAEPCFAQ